MRLVQSSDRSLLVVFGDEICADAHRLVLHLTNALRGTPGLLNAHPAYASLLIDFDPLAVTHRHLEGVVKRAVASESSDDTKPRTIALPVLYGGDYGPDLEDVARLTGLQAGEVIALHSGADYLVNFIGFSPGFPYLSGMPDRIAVPRLETPRRSVPAGSVAIGGCQTGVYPMATPGGWRIIGRTPLRLFQPDAAQPSLFRMGDHVRFVPLTKGDF